MVSLVRLLVPLVIRSRSQEFAPLHRTVSLRLAPFPPLQSRLRCPRSISRVAIYLLVLTMRRTVHPILDSCFAGKPAA
jgi:hypothetical protein